MPQDIDLPKTMQPFTYDGITYKGGESYHTDDPCKAIAFYDGFAQQNPNAPQVDKTKNAWADTYAACAAAGPPQPTAMPPAPGEDAKPDPSEGDGKAAQGAPAPKAEAVATTTKPEIKPDAQPAQGNEPTRAEPGKAASAVAGEKAKENTSSADPVDLFAGAFTVEEIDLVVPDTVLPLMFVRNYRSGIALMGPLGWNWDHGYNIYLRELADGTIAVWRQLHEDIFRPAGPRFEPPRGVFETLDSVAGLPQTYEVTGDGGMVMRFERPPGWMDVERIPLVRIADRHGNVQTLTYGTDDLLARVEDDDGHHLLFEYDLCGLLTRVSDGLGRAWSYGHDEQRFELTEVVTPAIEGHLEGIRRRYHYAPADAPLELRHNIVRVEDAAGRVYLENRYDDDPASISFARVIEQRYGGFLYQYAHAQLQWVPPGADFVNVPSWQVEAVNPDFTLETYTFNYRGDLLDRRFRLTRDKSYRICATLFEYDEQGNRTAVMLPDGRQELSVWDHANPDPRLRGKLLRRELTAAAGFPVPSRIIWRGEYEERYGLLRRARNEEGSVSERFYDFDDAPGDPTATGRLSRVKEPQVVLPDGTVQAASTRYEFDARGRLTATIAADGVRYERHYGTAGGEAGRLVREVTDAAGLALVTTTERDTFGYPAAFVDPAGNRTMRASNALGLVERIEQPVVDGEAAVYRFGYDSDRKLCRVERPRGAYDDPVLAGAAIVDRFHYDVLGFPTVSHFATNTATPRMFRTRNDYRGFPEQALNPDGSRMVRRFDERGLLLEEASEGSDGSREIRSWHYTRAGNLDRYVAPGGALTRMEQDGFGRTIRVRQPDQSEERTTWLADDRIGAIEIVGPDGHGLHRRLSHVAYGYDARGRRDRITVDAFVDDLAPAQALATQIVHDAVGRVRRIINPNGSIVRNEYDGAGRLVATIDPVGNVQRQYHDAAGNLVRLELEDQEPGGLASIVKRFTCDVRGRVVAVIEPDGAETRYVYDARGLQIDRIDSLGRSRTTEHDAFGNRMAEVHDALGMMHRHEWVLDAMARPTAYRDPTGEVTSYGYDGIGRLVSISQPNGFHSTRNLNSAGDVVEEKLGSGIIVRFGYDGERRLASLAATNVPTGIIPVPEHRFAYDGLGRLVRAEAGGVVVERRWDSLGRLVSDRSGGVELVARFDDLAGTLVRQWPDGREDCWTLDAADRPIAAERVGSGLGADGMFAQIAYSGSRWPAERRVDAGLIERHRYDARKRAVAIEHIVTTGMEALRYTYDAVNRGRLESGDGPAAWSRLNRFDARGRLLETRELGGTAPPPASIDQPAQDAAIAVADLIPAMGGQSFAYDAADARISVGQIGGTASAVTLAAGHRPTLTGAQHFAWSADGIATSDGDRTFRADALGRIVAVEEAGDLLLAIGFDPLGRVVTIAEQERPTRTLRYFGDFADQEDEGGIATWHVSRNPGDDMPIALHRSSGTLIPFHDRRRSLTMLCDPAGTVVERYRYDAFGRATILSPDGTPRATSSVGVAPVFAGQRLLPETGLYLSHYRLMDPRHGIFLSPDPRGYAASASQYVYAAQNPIDLIDPDGDIAFLAIFAIMAVGAVVAGGLNAVRQGIAMQEDPERAKAGFSWTELGKSMGLGAILAPIAVFAPEVAIPLAGLGVVSGASEISQGHYATGAFDIVTSLAPFGSKNVRGATVGKGSYFGAAMNKGPAVSLSTRAARFNVMPVPFGRKLGVAYTGKPDKVGHVGILLEDAAGDLTLYEKNGQRLAEDGPAVAKFNEESPPPETYFTGRSIVPFQNDMLTVPPEVADAAAAYALNRMAVSPLEPFSYKTANCSHFGGDTLAAAGFGQLNPPGTAQGLYSGFQGLKPVGPMSFTAPFFAKLPPQSRLSK